MLESFVKHTVALDCSLHSELGKHVTLLISHSGTTFSKRNWFIKLSQAAPDLAQGNLLFSFSDGNLLDMKKQRQAGQVGQPL